MLAVVVTVGFRRSHGQQQPAGAFEVADHFLQKSGRQSTVDDPVVIRQRQRHHQAGLNPVIDDNGQLPGPTDQQNGHLGPVDDRRRIASSDSAEITNGEGPATEIFNTILCILRFLSGLGNFLGDVRNRLPIAVPQNWHHQPTRGVNRQTDVDVILVDQFALFHVNRSIHHRVLPQRQADRLHDKGQGRELDVCLGVLSSAFFPQTFQLGDICVVEIGEVGNGRDTADRIMEELEIEGNILTNSEVVLHFGKPINIYEYIKPRRRLIHKVPFLSVHAKNNLVLNYFRYRLTHEFMARIYDNIYINFDHIFAASLYFWKSNTIHRRTLKNLLYINARDIKRIGKYNLHESIDEKISRLFMAEDNIYYDSILDLAIKQNILTKNHEIYHINHKKLNNPQEFHRDRLNNTLKIFVNELRKFQDIIKIFDKNARLLDHELSSKTFNILLRSDEKEYYQDYIKYFSEKESKPRKMGIFFKL